MGPSRTPDRHPAVTSIRPAGARAVLVEVTDTGAAQSLYAALRAEPPPGAEEIVPAARTVLIVSADPLAAVAAVQRWETAWEPGTEPGVDAGGDEVTLDVRYDGADLAGIAASTGLAADEVVRRHSATVYTVAFCGFAPGFGYLTGLPAALEVPRLATPRTVVPAGAVGLAGPYTGIYPRASPGGWQLIGRTDAVLWDSSRTPPALLAPGTTVRFRAVHP